MAHNPSHPSVRDVELAFLRNGWWLFPVLGAVCSLAVGGPFWQWVAGANPFLWPAPAGAAGRALAFAAAAALLPAAWWLGLKTRPPKYLAAALALAAVFAGECLLRLPRVQTPFWLAARERLAAGQYFMSEVCYVRLEEAAGRAAEPPAVVLVGSSQMLNGVDENLLRELLAPTPVIRRSMYGLTPLKALAMLSYVPFRSGDVCVQYLSEFDFTNQEEFPHAWFRPYASWKTLPDVVRCLAVPVRLRRWRELTDSALAATFEGWRIRDFARHVCFHFWRAGAAAGGPEDPPDPAAAAAQARGPLRFSAAEQRAFAAFTRRLEARQVALTVFEGDVNPAILSPVRLQAKKEVRRKLAGFDGMPNYRYVPVADQGLPPGPGIWRDMTHLNAAGRDLLTRRIAQEIRTR